MGYRLNPYTGMVDRVEESNSGVIDSATKLKITRTAQEDILSGEVLRSVSSTHVALATADTNSEGAQVIGIAENDALAGVLVDVVLLGVVTDSDFSIFSVQDQLFLDVDGAITNVKRSSGYHVAVGISLGGSDILFERNTPLVIA